MNVRITRTLRTASSERYLLHGERDEDVGALDIHFLNDGAVSGTLTLLAETLASDEDICKLLTRIDSELLPHASFDDQNIDFTIVVGRTLGSYVADGERP